MSSASPSSTSSPRISKSNRLSPEEHKRATRTARMIYFIIMASFLSICAIAVITTMSIEKNQTGFRAIKVKTPISGFDRTYMDDTPSPHQ